MSADLRFYCGLHQPGDADKFERGFVARVRRSSHHAVAVADDAGKGRRMTPLSAKDIADHLRSAERLASRAARLAEHFAKQAEIHRERATRFRAEAVRSENNMDKSGRGTFRRTGSSNSKNRWSTAYGRAVSRRRLPLHARAYCYLSRRTANLSAERAGTSFSATYQFGEARTSRGRRCCGAGCHRERAKDVRRSGHGGLAGIHPRALNGGHPSRLADKWCDAFGVRERVYRVDWSKHGRAAGPIRNQRMIDEGRPDLVLAFPGGRGTADMVRRARAAGIEVREIAALAPKPEGRTDRAG